MFGSWRGAEAQYEIINFNYKKLLVFLVTAPVIVTMTPHGAVWKQLLHIHESLTSLFYLSPVATCSSVFYLDVHSNWTTFREKFIIPVILSESFSSLMKPNVLSQTTQHIVTSCRTDWSVMHSSSAWNSHNALDSCALSKMELVTVATASLL